MIEHLGTLCSMLHPSFTEEGLPASLFDCLLCRISIRWTPLQGILLQDQSLFPRCQESTTLWTFILFQDTRGGCPHAFLQKWYWNATKCKVEKLALSCSVSRLMGKACHDVLSEDLTSWLLEAEECENVVMMLVASLSWMMFLFRVNDPKHLKHCAQKCTIMHNWSLLPMSLESVLSSDNVVERCNVNTICSANHKNANLLQFLCLAQSIVHSSQKVSTFLTSNLPPLHLAQHPLAHLWVLHCPFCGLGFKFKHYMSAQINCSEFLVSHQSKKISLLLLQGPCSVLQSKLDNILHSSSNNA